VSDHWSKAADGTFLDEKGGIVFFSCKRFVESICEGGSCFICGAKPGSKTFNDEHILPEWILREFSLFGREVVLPNGEGYKYGRYTIPCCKDCNSDMGRHIENPVSDLLHGGHRAIADYLQKEDGLLLMVWVALIFVKTHLRDKNFNMTLDRRVSQDPISSLYEWESLHHVHTFARCFKTGAEITDGVAGTCFILPAKEEREGFDYADLYEAQVALVRFHDIALLTVFNDSKAVTPHLQRILNRITGPLSSVQIREVMVEAACCNLHIKERPQFISQVDLRERKYKIIAKFPPLPPEFRPVDLELRGRLMEYALRNQLARATIEGYSNTDEFWSKVRQGLQTFLFDDDGDFIR